MYSRNIDISFSIYLFLINSIFICTYIEDILFLIWQIEQSLDFCKINKI